MKTYTQRLEIAFWAWMIPLMSESRLVQAFLPTALRLFQSRKNMIRLAKILAWAWVGLFLGLIVGFIRARVG